MNFLLNAHPSSLVAQQVVHNAGGTGGCPFGTRQNMVVGLDYTQIPAAQRETHKSLQGRMHALMAAHVRDKHMQPAKHRQPGCSSSHNNINHKSVTHAVPTTKPTALSHTVKSGAAVRHKLSAQAAPSLSHLVHSAAHPKPFTLDNWHAGLGRRNLCRTQNSCPLPNQAQGQHPQTHTHRQSLNNRTCAAVAESSNV
jgi:hypothetical protein